MTNYGIRHIRDDRSDTMTFDQHEFVKVLKPKVHQDLKLYEEKNLSLLGALVCLPLTRFDVVIFIDALPRFNHRHQVVHARRANVVVRWAERNAVDIVSAYNIRFASCPGAANQRTTASLV